MDLDQETGIAIDTAAVMSTVLEGVIYGISVMMFIGTIWVLMRKRAQSKVNRAMIIVACLMHLLSTAHLVIDTIRIHEGLVQYRDTFQPDGPIGFFSDISQWSFIYKHLVYTLQTLVADGVMIYRCYVVWKSWWIIVLPTTLWTAVAVSGFGCIYTINSRAVVNHEDLLAPATRLWITAFLVVSLLTNIVSTALLAFRIWKIGRRLTEVLHASHVKVSRPVVRIILDAGLLYSVSLLIVLICFLARNRGHYVLIDMLMPIISVTFYMVIIRTTLSRSTVQPIKTSPPSGERSPTLSRMLHLNREHEHQTRTTEVYIAHLTETSAPEHGDGNKEPKRDEETEGE